MIKLIRLWVVIYIMVSDQLKSEVSSTGTGQEILYRLSDSTSQIILVGGTAEDVRTVVQFAWNLREKEDSSNVELKIISSKDVLKTSVTDFVIGSYLSQLVSDNEASAVVSDHTHNRVVVGDQTAYTVISGAEGGMILSTDDTDKIQSLQAKYEEIINNSDAFKNRTPPISRIRTVLREEFDDQVVHEFNQLFSEIGKRNVDVSNAGLFLLLAAYENLLQYDICNFGERVGVASRATFSRKKNSLEDAGVLETEKVPIDIGRPRYRLKLTESAQKEVESVSDTLHL